MAKKYCKPVLSDNCGVMTSSSCVDYVGDLYPSNTSLDPEDCNNVTDVIEDLINIVDQHTEDLDFSEFGCCMEYEVSDEDRGITIKDVLSAHESTLCDHEDRLTKLEKGERTDTCKSEENSCDEEDSCCSILKQFDSYSQTLDINQNGWVKSTNNALSFKSTKSGTYKFTVEFIESVDRLNNQNAFLGISLNNFDPENSLFEQVEISPRHSKSVTFVLKMKINDTARLAHKRGTTNYKLDYVKMIVEKIK